MLLQLYPLMIAGIHRPISASSLEQTRRFCLSLDCDSSPRSHYVTPDCGFETLQIVFLFQTNEHLFALTRILMLSINTASSMNPFFRDLYHSLSNCNYHLFFYLKLVLINSLIAEIFFKYSILSILSSSLYLLPLIEQNSI